MSQAIRRSPLLSLALFLVASLVLVQAALSLPADKKKCAEIRTPRTFVDLNLSAGFTEFYTVPEGKRFVLTDITVTSQNDSAIPAHVGVSANMNSVRLPIVVCPPQDTVHVGHVTGPAYEAGDVLYFMGNNVGAIASDVYVGGYEVDVEGP